MTEQTGQEEIGWGKELQQNLTVTEDFSLAEDRDQALSSLG